MRIEIFVVLTEFDTGKATKDDLASLETLKFNIVRKLGGLTETEEERGYWHYNGQIFSDKVKRWIIYADRKYSPSETHQIGLNGLIDVAGNSTLEIIKGINKTIKKLTHQDSQAFGIDGKLYLV